MSIFRDDFYSTKPSRRSFSRSRTSRGNGAMWLAIALLVMGVTILAVIIAQPLESVPVSGEIGQPDREDKGSVNDQGAAGSENEQRDGGSGKQGSSGSGSNSNAGSGSGGSNGSGSVGSTWGSGAAGTGAGGTEEVEYRSEVAWAIAQVYDAVVSIVMESDEEITDWNDIYSIGSGIIFRVQGDTAYVVTNHHVASAAEKLEIVLSNGVRKKAELIGSDAISDLAVLKTSSEGISKVAVFGRSSDLQVGETAIAIGNPLGLGYAHTTTQGIISASELRTIPVSLSGNGLLDWEMEVIQTDAAINSGNSGGALINIKGEVIGINTMKIAWFGVEGLGFAIPIDQAAPLIEELVEKGRVSRPYLGITAVSVADYTDREPLDLPKDVKSGVVILSIDGPAKEAGLRAYDVIVRLDETKIDDMIDLRKYLYTQKKIGDPIVVTVYRNGRQRTYDLVLGELPG